MRLKSHLIVLLSLVFLSTIVLKAQNSLNVADFKNPPATSKVHTWWHWMDNSITKDGISKDLESMKQQGVVQATILNIGLPKTIPYDVKPVYFGTPEWYDMFHWSLKEANRLGIAVGFHNCDGWSTSGGPWVKPEESMKQYVWSKTVVVGGKEISTQLQTPIGQKGFYRDVAVVAFPITNKQNAFKLANPSVAQKNVSTPVLHDSNPFSSSVLKIGDEIDLSFPTELTTNKLAFYSYIINGNHFWKWGKTDTITCSFVLSSSVDGKVFTKIANVNSVGINRMNYVSMPASKAKFFKLKCTYCPNNYPLSEIEFLKDDELASFSPKISHLFSKTEYFGVVKESDYDLTPTNSAKGMAENSVINITEFMSADGKLTWQAPKGEWGIIRFGYTTNGRTNAPATQYGEGLEVDKMDTTYLNNHFNSFSKKLIDKAGSFTGNTFKFLLIDSWEADFQNWTTQLPQEFKKRRGYDITPWIPVLCGELIQDTKLSEAFLYDFRLTISDLVGDYYYKHFRDLCHRNKMEMHAEVIYGNTGSYPQIDVLKSNTYSDMPMMEFWARQNKDQLVEYTPMKSPQPLFSAFAALDGNKKIIGSEAYTGEAHYSESPFELKPYGDNAFCSGVNQMILHSYAHQPHDKKPGVTLWRFGSHFNRNNPWWNYSQDWMTYQARVQNVLQQGEPVVDFMFYIGDQLPQSLNSSFYTKIPNGFIGYPCNFDMLLNKAKIVDGKLSFGGTQKYAFLVLPDRPNMDLSTLKRIAELVNDGLIIYGPKPQEMLSLNDLKNNNAIFSELTSKLWGSDNTIKLINNQYGKGKVISGKPFNDVLNELNLLPNFTTNLYDAKNFMFFHKKMGNDDVFFVFNQQNRPINREMLFRVAGKTPEIWNAEDGTVLKPAIYSTEGKQTRIPVSFKPYQSFLFVFKNGIANNYINKVTLDGKQIFPQIQIADTALTIPQAIFANKNYAFTASKSGKYEFKTQSNQLISKSLVRPEEFEIKNFRGTISFSPITNEVIKPVEITSLKSLTEFDESAIKYFAGTALYSISFDAPTSFITNKDSVYLNIGKIDATAEVRLNGQLLAYAWTPYTKLSVSKLLKKNNKLEMSVAVVCRNRFIGDLNEFGNVQSLWTTSTINQYLKKGMPLKPSGVMGPISLSRF